MRSIPFAVAICAATISAAHADDARIRKLLEGLGAIGMTIRCPDVIQDFEATDEIFNDLKRQGIDVDAEPYDSIFDKPMLAGEKRVKEGDLVAYCAEMDRDYGPAGRIYPGLMTDRRR